MTPVPSATPLLRPKNPAERRLGGDGRAAVGLTGGLSAGKSTALGFFEALGARVASADAIVHRLYERDDVRDALAGAFGDGVLRADGAVDRRALAAAVVDDAGRLRALESLIHPFVSEEMGLFLAGATPGEVSVCEVPLLFESRLEALFDLVVTIEAPAPVRRDRVSARMDTDVFAALDARLAGEEERSAAADAVFVNEGSVHDLRAFVAHVYESARALAVGDPSGGESGA